MHWLFIVGVSLAAVVALVAVAVAILIYRFNRWADAMILSFGIPELWPPEAAETPDDGKSELCGRKADSTRVRNLRWDMPPTIRPAFRRFPSAKTQISPEK